MSRSHRTLNIIHSAYQSTNVATFTSVAFIRARTSFHSLRHLLRPHSSLVSCSRTSTPRSSLRHPAIAAPFSTTSTDSGSDSANASSSSSSASPIRPRRALLYMPGSSPKMLEKAKTLNVDTVCMDLEDAVAVNAKVEARSHIIRALNSWTDAKPERLVRINPVGSGFEQEDIEAILSADILPDGLVLPKVEHPAHLQWMDEQVERILGKERAKDMIFIALIESTEGMLNIRSIARSSKRLRAFIFGADDYRASVGAIKTPSNHEVSYARNLVLLESKAAGLDAIDLVQTEFRRDHLHVLEREAREGFEMGYTGKQIIHPNQIEVAQRMFAPDTKTVTWAAKVAREAEKHEAAGKGAFTVDGQMVDQPLIKKARQIIAKARMCGVEIPQQ